VLARPLTRSLNLGILAHVDAGKTTLTERLLHLAGVLDAPGSVDSGTTQTDTLAIERRRGITIRAAVVAFPLGDLTVNVVDTPGHPDFIAEVERSLGVLDGAVLVLSAVEGVQPQTRILMRALQRLRVPTLLFVNKIDRVGADLDRVVTEIRSRLTPDVLAMGRVLRADLRPRPSLPTVRTIPRSPSTPRRPSPSTMRTCSRHTSMAWRYREVSSTPTSPRRPARASCTRSSQGRPQPVPVSVSCWRR
jgi:small GTP-binding protein